MKMVTSQDSKVFEAKLLKLKALKDSPAIEVGESFYGHYFDKPLLGENFIFFRRDEFATPFKTTKVTKIVNEFTFETKNSIYSLIDKSRERDMRIEDLLK